MEIILTDEEVMECIFDGLCNSLGLLQSSGIVLEYEEEDYKAAKKDLKERRPNTCICYEDVLCEILRIGKPLVFVDVDSADDDEYRDRTSWTFEDAKQRFKKPEAAQWINQVIPSDEYSGDACTGYNLLQIAAFDEIIYG